MNFLIHTRRGTISRQTTSPAEPPEDSLLLGVGSESTSLTLYPRIQNTTIGNWYVDASRPISGDGTTLATAFKTLQEGLNALQSGQTLLVKGGTYTPGRILRNTAWGSTTRIMGYGNDRPILDFDGVDMTWPNRHCLVIQSGSRNELWHRFYFINSRNDSNTGGVVSINAPTTTISDIWASHMDYRTVEISGVTNGWVTVQDCVGWRMGDGSSANTSTGEHFLIVGSGRDSHPEELRFVRCVSINGGDDGYDLWSARSALILDSVSIGAGFYWNGNVAGDGNAYKMGGDNANGRNNRIRGSVAAYSSRYGIDANISASSQYGHYHYVNNTTVYNDSQGFFLGNHVHVENNIDYGNGASYRSPGASTTYSNNQWNLSISNPQLANPSEHDFSLVEGSPALGVGTGGANLGASTVALELTKLWASRDTTGYALPEWFDEVIIPPVEPPEEPEETILLGVGSTSTSLNLYPKIQNTTEGDWYVDGSRQSSGNGTSLETAFRTIQEGLDALQDGQTLLVKGGTYNLTNRINRTSNWSSTTRIMAYGDDRPILTGVGFPPVDDHPDAPLRFQSQSRNELWHRFYIRDVTAGHRGVMVAGENTVVSDIWVSHVSLDGIYVSQEAENVTIQDCAVWRIGDGSSVHTNTGDCYAATAWTAEVFADGRFIRCFGANGPDDVYDLWGARDWQILDCVAFGGGYYWNGNPGSSSGGDGGGYKLGGGGNGLGKRNTIIGSLALGNRTQGYQFNHSASPAEHTIINNTAYNNGGTGVSYGTASTTRSNISYQNGSSHEGSGGTVTNNSWQVGVSNPQFADIGNHDYSLASNSGGIGTGYGGENLGASEEALRIAKIWLNRDLTGYAQPEWDYDSPPTQTQSYTIDNTTNFLNPERGWHSDRASTSDFAGLRSGQWQNTPQTLNRWLGRLDQFRDSAISQNWLNSHANVFQAARDAGIKLELRYAYSYNPPTSPPDAEPSRIIQHINQLGPIWQANADVINTIQAGFVGRWGEWNASGFGITSGADPTVRNSIIQALVDNVPENRMITLRYPEMTAEYFGHHVNQYPSYPAPVSHSERFTGTPKARLGLLNDSFLANHTDGGTFVVNRYTGNYSTNTHSMAYWVSTSRYTANSGETVDLDWRDGNREAGAASIARMEELNWDILNRAYSTRVIDGWISSGHYEEISRRLGYRLGLTSVTLPQYIRQGAYFTVEFTLQNDGFGKVFNPRPIDLVLTPSTGSPVRVRLTSDARRDLPLGGETSTLTYVATLPGNAPTGSYTAGISLPDPYPSLENDARYSIRLANTGDIWNGSTGVNNLGLSVSIV